MILLIFSFEVFLDICFREESQGILLVALLVKDFEDLNLILEAFTDYLLHQLFEKQIFCY